MRINKFIASASGLSRRKADSAILSGRVTVNGEQPSQGQDVTAADKVLLDNRPLTVPTVTTTIMLNKPIGYVVSRDGQGSKTIYELLPQEYILLKPIGRLDKDSSGLLLLTNNGDLVNELTHPSKQKTKVYEITLHKPLKLLDQQTINNHGVKLEDGISKLKLTRQASTDDTAWTVTMHEGRNRQIRRTFNALGYEVTQLKRTEFGEYSLSQLGSSRYAIVR
jgi:23S rRNA pseudouridine2605 synthase